MVLVTFSYLALAILLSFFLMNRKLQQVIKSNVPVVRLCGPGNTNQM